MKEGREASEREGREGSFKGKGGGGGGEEVAEGLLPKVRQADKRCRSTYTY